jgi:hypothetical protein
MFDRPKLNPIHVRFDVSTAVTIRNDVFWDVRPCGSCKNRRFGGTYSFHHQGVKGRTQYVSMSSLPIEENYVRFEVLALVATFEG